MKDKSSSFSQPFSAEILAAYHAGELSDAEAHALERAAMDDPFLAEALEGLESLPVTDWVSDAEKLLGQIDEEVADEKVVPLAPWWKKPWAVAAAVALLMSASILFWRENSPIMNGSKLSLAEEAPTTESSTLHPIPDSTEGSMAETSSTDTTTEPVRNTELLMSDADGAIADEVVEVTPPNPVLEEVSIEEALAVNESNVDDQPSEALEKEGMIAVPEADYAAFADGPAEEEELSTPEVAVEPDLMMDSAVAVGYVEENPLIETEEVTVEPILEKTDMAVPSRRIARDRAHAGGFRAVSGKIIDENGEGLPGVTVRVTDYALVSTTDVDGVFLVMVPLEADSISFSYIGYESQVRSIEGKSQIEIEMAANTVVLSEVVVVNQRAYEIGQFIANAERFGATPIGGFGAFYELLLESIELVKAEGEEMKYLGKVVIGFTVDTDGIPADFKVIESVGYGLERKIIEYIQFGPMWEPDRRGGLPVPTYVEMEVPIY